MRKISVKLGIILSALFFTFVMVISYTLYSFMVHFYIKQVATELLHRGHSHAIVLANHFDHETMHHVAMMEGPAITMVVILDNQGKVLANSDPILPTQRKYLIPMTGHPASMYEEIPLETDWEHSAFIATRSPILNGNQLLGTVVMFSPTDPIRDVVRFLKVVLLWFGLGMIIVGFILIFYLSSRITKPLIQMKAATQNIAKGNYGSELRTDRNDELGDLAASINSLAKSLQHYEQTRTEFLADVSHELRTPLTYLKGYSEILLQDRITNEEEKKEFLKIIRDESIRVHLLVQDLFELTKMEVASVPFEKNEIDLVSIIEKIAERLRPAYDSDKIELNLENVSDSVFIEGDSKRIEQVFLNLLDNARRYTSSGGKVEIVLEKSETVVVIKVIDTGMGIPKSELPLIWKRLYRVEKSRSRVTGGSGLGLAIVKKIVDLHNGSITVDSIENKGTTFTLHFPIL
jgi:two-component system, OmpR family, sensor histidine kinase BaeS